MDPDAEAEMIVVANIKAANNEWITMRCNAQCPRCQLGIALNRARSDQSQIVGFVI